MEILYISCYPSSYFKRLINESKTLSSQPAQKFNKLFVDGFKQNGVNISVLSTFNHISWDKEKLFVKKEFINENGIKYFFLPSLKIKYLNFIYMHFALKKFLTRWKRDYPEGIIIIDFLKPFSWLISKYGRGNKILTIVTDLPEFLLNDVGDINKIKNKIKLKNYNKVIEYSTHYIFLTEQMNNRLNKDKKPHCIIEGLVDYNMKKKNEVIQNDTRKICLYSGALHKKYGIANLVEAFTSTKLKKYELHLYGTGDYVSELKQVIKKHRNIKYFGNVENTIVVQKQLEASILINPRPTNEEYTKYSFPSKNMEYMVSGTPVITTELPGMPDEYKKYVYLMKGFDVEDIISSVYEVLTKPDDELKQKGVSARNFVLKDKNNIVQTKKIIDMLKIPQF
ncbi:glycosyltransferase [Bacillus canaveralius]|nr:glycosyltransferase [Bacillus canaveralius]